MLFPVCFQPCCGKATLNLKRNMSKKRLHLVAVLSNAPIAISSVLSKRTAVSCQLDAVHSPSAPHTKPWLPPASSIHDRNLPIIAVPTCLPTYPPCSRRNRANVYYCMTTSASRVCSSQQQGAEFSTHKAPLLQRHVQSTMGRACFFTRHFQT